MARNGLAHYGDKVLLMLGFLNQQDSNSRCRLMGTSTELLESTSIGTLRSALLNYYPHPEIAWLIPMAHE